MKLRARFQLTGAISVGAILLVALGVAWSLREAERARVDADLARLLMKEQYERALLRDDYLLSRGERARKQWEEKSGRMPGLLAHAAVEYEDPRDQRIVGEMFELYERTALLFREILVRDAEEAQRKVRLPLAAELRERSIATLRIVANDLYSQARLLSDSAATRLSANQRVTTIALVALLGAVFAVTFVNARMALVTLERRVTRLSEGAAQVAAGKLDHRIAIQGDDELVDLGNTFDRMTEKLQRSYAALEVSNRELEAFSYAVSHDLRAPLRSVAGFSQAVLEDYGPQLDDKGRQYLEMAAEASREMGQLIDDLLRLSRVSRSEMERVPVDLSAMAASIVAELRSVEPDRVVEVEIAPELGAEGDPTLLRLVLENLLRNAWKFTSHHASARITVGRMREDGRDGFFVADDGAGFDMAYVRKLFQPFQRLHRTAEFPGTGIGLATVIRIIRRHGGAAWAKGEVEKGATIYFTLSGEGGMHGEQGDPVGGGQPEGRAPHGAGLQAEQDRQRSARGA